MPAVVPVLGLASCVLLMTQVEAQVWTRGSVLVAAGAVLAAVAAVRARRQHPPAGAED